MGAQGVVADAATNKDKEEQLRSSDSDKQGLGKTGKESAGVNERIRVVYSAFFTAFSCRLTFEALLVRLAHCCSAIVRGPRCSPCGRQIEGLFSLAGAILKLVVAPE